MSDTFDYDDFFGPDDSDDSYLVAFTELKHTTEKAYLFVFGTPEEGNVKEIWLPKSQCELQEEGTVLIKEWLVTEHELEEFVQDEDLS